MHILKDEEYMRRCLQLARNGMQNAKPNPMVGAVIVAEDGRIIGEGYIKLNYFNLPVQVRPPVSTAMGSGMPKSFMCE